HAIMIVGFDHYDLGLRVFTAGLNCFPQVLVSLGAGCDRAQARGVGYKVDGNDPLGRSVASVPVLRAETLASTGPAQAPDARKSMIVENDDVELYSFLDCGHDFLRHHQIRTIPDQNVNLTA